MPGFEARAAREAPFAYLLDGELPLGEPSSGKGTGVRGADDAASVEHTAPVIRREGDERFRRANHLRSPRDFQRVRARGRRYGGEWLTLHVARQDGAEPGPTRVGFSVSKRVGGAVVRNRVKRRLRESIRRQISQLHMGWDIIVSARPQAAQAEYATLDAELRALCQRARLVRSIES